MSISSVSHNPTIFPNSTKTSQMVTQGYFDTEDRVYGRHSGRGHGYPLNHDRDLPSSSTPYASSRNHQLSLQESRGNGQIPDQESASSHPRRRIPVACGRCRKRKIRCSGDPGNGGACSGCKAAGNEKCQFLRVLSTEAQMKPDAVDYNYDSTSTVARVNCRIVPYGPQAYAPPAIPLGSDGFPYRQSPLSTYPYHGKGYYGVQSYSEFTEENIDYGLQSSPYPLLNAEHMNLGSTYSCIGRAWAPAPQLPKSNILFLGEDSPYSHSQLHYPNNGYALRPTISPDSKGMSMSGISNSLPALVNGTDRVLPVPAHRTFLRSNDAQSARSLEGMHPYTDLLNNNMISSNKSLSSNSASENGSISSSYVPLSQSRPDTIATTQISCTNQSLSTNNQQTDLYSHNNNNRLYNSINTSSSEDLHGGSYGVVSPSTTKRPLHGSRADSSMSSSSPGDLANGHNYVPYQHQSYPPPPIEMQAPVNHRGSDTSIQASA